MVPCPRYFVETHDAGNFEEMQFGSGELRMTALEVKASLVLKCRCGNGEWEVNVLG